MGGFLRVCRAGQRDEGAAAVEFAIVALLLFTLLFGIIQFGWLFYQWNEITHAAREGARWGALEYDIPTIRTKTIASAPGMGLEAGDITVLVDGVAKDPTIADVGKPVSVTVVHDAPVFVPLFEAVFGGSSTVTLRSTATLRIE